jgi:hypothetical protein
MTTEIAPIPLPVPREIIEAAANEQLVVFIGAGVSRLVGSMGWDQLARNLVEKCYTTIGSSGERCISFRERSTLLDETDHKKTITVCHHILKTNGCEGEFYLEFDRALEGTPPGTTSARIYEELARLPAVFVTTNADTHFGRDPYFRKERILYRTTDFQPAQIEARKLYHIHGVKTHRETLVFTVDQYIMRYNDDLDFVAFMKHLLSQCVVLFLGYGLGEYELLDFLFTKYDAAQRRNEPREIRHFTLLPYFKDDVNILRFDQSYYGRLGITVLGYQKDVNGYEQLYDVVKTWNKEILQVSPILPRTITEIDRFIADPTQERLSRLLQTIRHDDASRTHFFRAVTKIGDPRVLLQPLRDEGYFNPTNNPTPQEDPKQKGYFSIPGWQVLPYLECVAEYNQQQPSDVVTAALLDVVARIGEDETLRERQKRNYHTEAAITRIIARLPHGVITPKHIGFVGVFLQNPWDRGLVAFELGKNLIPRLAEAGEKDLLLQMLDAILGFERRDDKYVAMIDGYWLAEILNKRGPQITNLCGVESLRALLRKIHAVVDQDKSQFNSVWIGTIEGPSEQHAMYRYDNVVIAFARMIIAQLNPPDYLGDVKALLEDEHPIFLRLGFHAVTVHYDIFKSLFWGLAANPLDKRLAKPEVYRLLARHCGSFSSEEIGQVLGWIESSEYYLPEEIQAESEEAKRAVAYRKKEWLSALQESTDERVRESFAKYDRICPGKVEHPGHNFWSETRSGRPASALDWATLIQKSDEDLTKTLNEYREGDGWDRPTRRDVASELSKCVAENPARFSESIDGLRDLDDVFRLALLAGLRDAWNQGKNYKWDSVLQFLDWLLRNERAVTGEHAERYVREIAGLIRAGTAQDNHAFDAALLPLAENILLRLVNVPVSDIDATGDIVHAVIHSTKYDVFRALLDYALRSARMAPGGRTDRWPPAIKDMFQQKLDRRIEPSEVYSFFLGERLPHLVYLDRDWVYANLDRIFPSADSAHWMAAFAGYLLGTKSVYEEFYKALRSGGHYHTAISVDFQETHLNDRVTDHICIGYLHSWEDLNDDDSLISAVLRQKRVDRLDEIVDAFWRWRGESADLRDKVKLLWQRLYEILSPEKANAEFRKPLANLHRWLALTDTIDKDVRDWVLTSVDCLDHSWDAHLLVEYLAGHVHKSPHEVGEIYLHMVGRDLYPDYRKEDIRTIVEGLYQNGCEEQANRICNLYLFKGYEFLRDIWSENNQPNSQAEQGNKPPA